MMTQDDEPAEDRLTPEKLRSGPDQHGAAEGGLVGSSRTCQGSGMADLPDEVLAPILQTALGLNQEKPSVKPELVCGMCQAWKRVISRLIKRVRLANREVDVGSALSELREYRGVTHVRLEAVGARGAELLRALADGFPLITSFRVELYNPWEGGVWPALAHFLSRRSSLQELWLKFSVRPWSEDNPASEAIWREHHKAVEALDLRALMHLKRLELDYSQYRLPQRVYQSAIEDPRLNLPVCSTTAALSGLDSLHLLVSDVNEAAQLPPWLTDFGPFVSLRLITEDGENEDYNLMESVGTMRTLQEIVIDLDAKMCIGEVQFLSDMPSLTALSLSAWELMDAGYREWELLQDVIYNPRLRKLRLDIPCIPPLLDPMPLLEDLALHVWVDDDCFRIMREPHAHMQRNFFEFTPALRSLELDLGYASEWPALGAHLAGLTSLTVNCNELLDRKLDIRRAVPTIRELNIENCMLLRVMKGWEDFGPATAASLKCRCHVSVGRVYKSHAEYAAAGKPCWYVTQGEAWKLFRDTRSMPQPAGRQHLCLQLAGV